MSINKTLDCVSKALTLYTIQKSGERAATIVQDFLTLARRGVATMVAVDFNQTVTDYLVSPEFRKLASFHPRVKVESRLSDDLLNVSGSPVHLSKTIMNLVSNAAEAMPEGGRIIISTKNRYVERCIKGYDEVIEGEGTTVTIYLLITRKDLPEQSEKSSVEIIQGNGQCILVVDDMPEQRKIVSAILDRLGYIVVTVASGEAAVDYLKNHSVDLMVLDMIMDPGIDGLETYRQVVAFKPGQKAVIASGYSESEQVKSLQRLGVHEYLKKPYTLEKIGLAIKRTLSS